MRRWGAIVAVIATAGGGSVPRESGAATAPERRLAILYTAGIHGAVEPCGCNSDPLGDVSRLASVARLARKEMGTVLFLDAGDLLYPQGAIPTKKREASDLRGTFLAEQLVGLGLDGAALGETDLARGAERVQPRRLASNLTAPFVERPRVRTVGSIKVGVVGVADPALGGSHGIGKNEDPVEAVKRDAQRLRAENAEIIVVLAPVDRALARRIAREAPVDFVVLGAQGATGLPRAEAVGRAFLVAPADELQRVGRINLILRDHGAPKDLKDAGGKEARRVRLTEIERALKTMDADLDRWAKDGAKADAAFVTGKRRERENLSAERRAIESSGDWRPPAAGSYFTNELIPLSRGLPRDKAIAAAMKRLDARIAAAYLRNKAPPQEAETGRASYVGDAKCVKCHKTETQFWKKTIHARAWKTLVDGGKAADPDCVMCHVVGFDQVGGSTVGFTKGLENVQCEACHGPASIHVAELGTEEPLSVKRDTPESTCTVCHNEKHSDTFQYEAYLRDVLGAGHGGERRQKLGDGPTGKKLRAAALAKAKAKAQIQRTKR